MSLHMCVAAAAPRARAPRLAPPPRDPPRAAAHADPRTPSARRPSTNSWSYGDPSTGCKSTELNVSITGISGDVCSPKCLAGNKCPTDLPAGVPAATVGQCVLEDQSSTPNYCVLICELNGGRGGAARSEGQGRGGRTLI